MNWTQLIQQLGFPTAWSCAIAYAIWKLAAFSGRRLFAESDGYITRLVDSTVRMHASIADAQQQICQSVEAMRLMLTEDISAREQRDERLLKALRRRRRDQAAGIRSQESVAIPPTPR